MRRIGVWEDVVKLRACPYFDMEVWDGDGTADIHFDCAEIYSDNLGHIVENSVLLSQLQQRLLRNKQVDYRSGCKVVNLEVGEANNGVTRRGTLTLSNGETLRASLVVAADGAKSPLRTMAGIATREWDYRQSAIVTSVRHEQSHQFTAWQRFSTDGPLAFLPLSRDGQEAHWSSIVWSLDTPVADANMQLDDQAFAAELQRAFESRLGPITEVDRRHCIALRQCHARRYYHDAVVLVGDAAHSIHPLAGQGANLGFYDAQTLAEEAGRALARGLSLADLSIRQRYERQRKPHNLAAMAAMEGFKRLFGSRALPLRLLRNEGLRQVNRLPWLKDQFAKFASGR